MRVLVTGGAGYIGSAVVRDLLIDHDVLVLDDLSTGRRRDGIDDPPLIVADIADANALGMIRRTFRPEVLAHCAALIDGPESTTDPLRYYDVNVARTITLLRHMAEVGCRRVVFLSSVAAEDSLTPYGLSKALVERVLSFQMMPAVVLRPTNVGGRLGVLTKALRAQRTGEPLVVSGMGWQTRDGTAIRDYVHVEDIAAAVRAAVETEWAGYHRHIELGSGVGTTVLELLAMVEQVTGRPVPWIAGPRRAGDHIGSSIAKLDAAEAALGWRPTRSLRDIVETAVKEAHDAAEA